jgi:hypothetical protein
VSGGKAVFWEEKWVLFAMIYIKWVSNRRMNVQSKSLCQSLVRIDSRGGNMNQKKKSWINAILLLASLALVQFFRNRYRVMPDLR